MPESFESKRIRVHIPDPYPRVDPGVYAGVPGAPITLDDIFARRHVCFTPDELRSILERARALDPGDELKEYVVTARVDQATMYFLRSIQARYRVSRSTIIRLGVYLLKEALEKQQD